MPVVPLRPARSGLLGRLDLRPREALPSVAVGRILPRGERDAVDRETDYVDEMIAQWGRIRPELDVSAVAVIGRISRACRYFEQRIETQLRHFDLKPFGLYVLAALRRSGPPYMLSPTDLYSSLLVSSGAMTNRIDRLEHRGLVKRLPDPADGRGVLVALTDDGMALIDEVMEAHAANELAMLAALPRRDRERLATLLRRLLVGLEPPHPRPRNGSPATTTPYGPVDADHEERPA